jgi:hypothetical protein
MPQRRQGNVHNNASAAMMPLPQQQQWQWRQSNVCKDPSVAMATMPKRRGQRQQPDDHDDASARTAMMATAPGQRPQGQCNACINTSGMLAMTPVATLPRKAISHNNFAILGNFAKDNSFAEEGNFTAEGNVAEGR